MLTSNRLVQALLLLNLALFLALLSHLALWRQTPLLSIKGGGRPLRSVSLAEVTEALRQPGTLLVDARSSPSYKFGHIPGAVSLPAADVVNPEVLKQALLATQVIVYCEGARCSAARTLAEKLRDSGVSDPAVYQEGFQHWSHEGQSIERASR